MTWSRWSPILVVGLVLGACAPAGGTPSSADPTPSTIPAPIAEPTPFPWILVTEGASSDVEEAVLGWAADMGIDARRGAVPVGEETPAGLAAAVGPEADLREVAAGWGEAGVSLVILDPATVSPGPTTSTIGPGKRTDQVGFLAGLAAGYATSQNGIGLAPGVEGEYAEGLGEGVRYACPRCRQESIADPAAVPFGVDVIVFPPDSGWSDADPAAGLWVVVAGSDDAESLAARVITDPVPLVLAALEALMGGEPGRGWLYEAENGGLRIVDVDPRAISPGRERLLRDGELRLRLGELVVGGGA